MVTVAAMLVPLVASCEMLSGLFGTPDGTGDEPIVADEFEVNDDRGSATQIQPATDVSATIAPADDVDWFVFDTANTQEWDWVEFDVTGVSADMEVWIGVYNESGEEILSGNPGTAGADLTETISTPGGTYYVQVASNFSGDIGRYTLNVHNLGVNDQYAPNDSRDAAYDLGTLPVSEVDGMIVSSEEDDWYRITTSNPGIWDYVQFDITNVQDTMEVWMAVYNDAGEEVFRANPGTAGADLSQILVTNGGAYYVWIGSNFGGDYGSYTLAAFNQDANDAYEPNDTKADAADLGELDATNVLGTVIWSPVDEDWYSFTARNDNTITISLTGVGSELEPFLRLEDSVGNSYEYIGTAGSDVTITTDDMTSITPADGETYYLKVVGNFDQDHGDYTLSVAQP